MFCPTAKEILCFLYLLVSRYPELIFQAYLIKIIANLSSAVYCSLILEKKYSARRS